MRTTYKHKCLSCNTEFTSLYTHTKFCSQKCYWINKKDKPQEKTRTGDQKTCPICNKIFYVQKHLLEKRIYCSTVCKNTFLKKDRVERKCIKCGKIFQVRKSKSTQKYCSILCTSNKKEKQCLTCKKIFIPISGRQETQNYCSQKCVRRTDEFKEKISLAVTGRISITRGKPRPWSSGENSSFWKGGVSEKNRTERQNFSRTLEYINFRREILKRDNYTCQMCGDRTKKGHRIKLNVDHIKPFLLYPDLRLDLNNARTLCEPCHHKTETYGAKVHRSRKIDVI